MRYVLDRLQSRINEEYTDISSRIGWLMTGQAFLLGAFATILNAEHLGDEAKHWFSTGVAFSGAVISFVLALSTFFGHALIQKIKKPRDEAEIIMADEFHVPERRSGQTLRTSTRPCGHTISTDVCLCGVGMSYFVGANQSADKAAIEGRKRKRTCLFQ
jgi:hypothetical protein